MSTSFQSGWFAARVRSNHEEKVGIQLAERGFEAFSPTYEVRRRWTDRWKTVELPLIPGYVFCRLYSSDWLPVLQTPGVVHMVGYGKTPVPVDEREMESLRILAGSGLPAAPHDYLRVGQLVRVCRGPLLGLEGMLESIKNSHRITISITLLQRSVSTEIEASWALPVAAAHREGLNPKVLAPASSWPTPPASLPE